MPRRRKAGQKWRKGSTAELSPSSDMEQSVGRQAEGTVTVGWQLAERGLALWLRKAAALGRDDAGPKALR